jgi:NosR/NirI family nitrite reductase transcriptional regulator
MRLFHALVAACLLGALPVGPGESATAADLLAVEDPSSSSAPDSDTATRLFATDRSVYVTRGDGSVPGWSVTAPDGPVGFIASTWEVAHSLGYSGRPIDILVAVTDDGRIAGAELVRHNEPILTLGISTADIARYINGFADIDLDSPQAADPTGAGGAPDVISRATVTSTVIRDAILRTARTVHLARNAPAGGEARIDRVSFEPLTWTELQAQAALARTAVSLDRAREALADARNPPPPGEAPYIELWVAILDPPTIGRNLLGQAAYSRAMAGLGAGEVGLFVASRGLYSHRGTAWRRSGVFERLQVAQGAETLELRAESYRRVADLAPAGAPEFKEVSVFGLPTETFDPTREFRVELIASLPAENGSVSLRIPLSYKLPERFVQTTAALPDSEPLWIAAWQRKRAEIAAVALMLVVLALILFLQEAFVRRPRLWRWGRTIFLAVTLVWLGWIAGGQLSVVHVVAFVQSLLSGFRWETFLIEPIIFILWSFVALGLLFWGRGVFCGWLCPFGALQELINQVARRLAVPQLQVPHVVHERLWVIKYTLFVAILGLSFYSMEQALVLAEVEPFKTAMSMRFMRAWPFVLFVVAILAAGLFIERFYCRYLCPLGAALAIPAKLKIFDWLKRRSQCGRECRLCEQQCTVGAIDSLGRINPNECVLCLRCQMIYHDWNTCTVLKRRQARKSRAPAGGDGASVTGS